MIDTDSTSRQPVDFRDIKAETPTLDGVRAEYAAVEKVLNEANDPVQREAAIRRWFDLRDRLNTWGALVEANFHRDTRNPDYKRSQELLDSLSPKLQDLEVGMKRRLLERERDVIERGFGPYLAKLWEVDLAAFDPAIMDDLEEESKLKNRYTELSASAKLEFQGEETNLSGILKWTEDADRDVRHRAEQVRWGFYDANREELDELYDKLVKLRDRMARKLGYENYLGFGYRRMRRTDYGPADVAAYRDQIAADVVPLVQEILERRRKAMGLDTLYFWDEGVADPRGNPRPQGDLDWIVAQARTMYDRMDPRLSGFYRMMEDHHLLDLDTRPGKAGGGFCTSFPSYGVPFIFANFNGTKGDVDVLTHEMGHAFQAYSSRHHIPDFQWPTSESAEIHSMSLEFLCYPYMDLLFGDDADRYRRVHMEESLRFLPYGVSIDHFQHLVYENPSATPADRHEMWREVERRYMPWANYGDLKHLNDGGRWQQKLHVYVGPLYYIDYTLAQCCALQFWSKAESDREAALETYAALCRRGGEAPFQELVKGAGLVSPFRPGALADVAAKARGFLGL